MAGAAPLTANLVLAKGGAAPVGGERIALLEAIRDRGSIVLAAKAMGLSYKGAWDAVQAINNLSTGRSSSPEPAADGAASRR
ncbi:MAG TPA: hypothetical protein VGF71_04095 [Caulobacteraceae bacterium]|jgi:molybdate transport system regulatory protein